jgi:hypothetical protein
VGILENDWNITLELGTSNSSIKIWKEGQERVAIIDKQFNIIRDAECRYAQLLDPIGDEWDKFRIYPNGSLYFTYPEIDEEKRLHPPNMICFIPVVKYFQPFSARRVI